ncbi:MAG TPA: ADOP family duplicated permease [Vicinamibacterales bacterium]|nr:ADOP family duplicated permease [Vicinamibacterales bacterium]
MRGLSWFTRRRTKDIAEEIDTHLAMATRDYVARGMAPDEARHAALREFGNVPLIQQTAREVWSWTWLEQLLQDLRIGARILTHAPGLSGTAVLLVALVIGGNTTIYSIVHGILTSPAPGVHNDRLITIKRVVPDRELSNPYTSYPNYLDYRRLTQTTRALAGWTNDRMTLGADSGTYAVFGALVTPNYFDTFGVRMTAGRSLRADDDRLANGLVAIISERVWRERFEAAEDIVGRAITVNGNPATIVGVATAGFIGVTLTPGEDVWLPIEGYYQAIGDSTVLAKREHLLVLVAGQLAPTASLSQARAEFDTISAQLGAEYQAEDRQSRGAVLLYSSTSLLPIEEMSPYFLALFSVVTVLTLLIVSANVANLMLGRAVARQRDTAVRLSLGAPRVRIVRMLLAEGAAIATSACLAAYLLTWWTSRALVRVIEPRPGLLPEISPDWAVASYAMVLAVLATMAFSVAPALYTWRQPVLPLLRSGEQALARGRSRLSTSLVVLQLAFSVLLLTSAGLAYRSLSLLDSGDVGFDPDNLLLVRVRAVTASSFATELTAVQREAGFALLERVRDGLATVPNVMAVSYARRIPGAYLLSVTPVHRVGDARPTMVFFRPVGPDYLRTLGLAPVAGRALTSADRRGAPRRAMINEHLASDLWPARSAIGQTLLVGVQREPVEVVGVTPNALFDGPTHNENPRYVLVAEQQLPGSPALDPIFYIRYAGALDVVTPAVSKAIADVDKDLPIVTMTTMTSSLQTVTSLEQIVTTFLLLFALPSLLIAALGQYAVTMFNMRRRTRDFGVRLALGASAAQVQRAVVRESLQLTAVGLAIGLVLSVGVAVAGESVLFGVTPTDPPTYAGVFTLLATASLLASFIPAWRAGRVNVVDALRTE